MCIGHQNISAEIRLFQLRQYVAGEALKCFSNFGYSTMYKASRTRLEKHFGGARCHLAIHLEVLDKFPLIRSRKASELKKFVELLDVAALTMKEAGCGAEQEDRILYMKLKLFTCLLTQFKRWVVKHWLPESAETLLC